MVVILVGPLLVFISARYWERKSACGWPNNFIVKSWLSHCRADGCYFCRSSVGIYIGPRLGAQIRMRSLQRLANGWPNDVIVKLTVGPLQGPLASPTMNQCSLLENESVFCRFKNWPAIGCGYIYILTVNEKFHLFNSLHCLCNCLLYSQINLIISLTRVSIASWIFSRCLAGVRLRADFRSITHLGQSRVNAWITF